MSIANGLALPTPLSNGTTADAVQVMNDLNYILNVINRALLDSGGSAGMNAQSTQIHNLANGTAANDAVNLSQLQAYLPLAGGTLTGALAGTSLSLSSTLSVSGASTLAALTASGLITGNAGFSGTTLSLSSTLNVTGASTLAALTASGLITGNAGFSGTTLSLSSTLSAGGKISRDTNFWMDVSGTTASLNMGSNDAINVDRTNHKYLIYANGILVVTIDSGGSIACNNITAGGLITGNAGFSGTTLSLSSTLNVTGASTLAALTASGLITGNAGFSGTTLSLSSTLSVTGAVTATGALTTGTAANCIGYLGLPQSAVVAAYTLALSDAGGHKYWSGSTAYTVTIPANATTAFPVGTVISLVNDSSVSQSLSPAGGVTLVLAGGATTGSRTLAAGAVCSLLKVATDKWYVSGSGVS